MARIDENELYEADFAWLGLPLPGGRKILAGASPMLRQPTLIRLTLLLTKYKSIDCGSIPYAVRMCADNRGIRNKNRMMLTTAVSV